MTGRRPNARLGFGARTWSFVTGWLTFGWLVRLLGRSSARWILEALVPKIAYNIKMGRSISAETRNMGNVQINSSQQSTD